MVDRPARPHGPTERKAEQFRSFAIDNSQDVVAAYDALHNILWNDPCLPTRSGLLGVEELTQGEKAFSGE